MAATGILSSRAVAVPDAPTADATPAMSAPASRAGAKVAIPWHRVLVAHIAKYKSYRQTDIERTVIVEFTVDRNGHIAAAKVRKTSGDAAIDDAGLAMVRRADPVPPPPAAVADDELAFQLPVVFRPPATRR